MLNTNISNNYYNFIKNTPILNNDILSITPVQKDLNSDYNLDGKFISLNKSNFDLNNNLQSFITDNNEIKYIDSMQNTQYLNMSNNINKNNYSSDNYGLNLEQNDNYNNNSNLKEVVESKKNTFTNTSILQEIKNIKNNSIKDRKFNKDSLENIVSKRSSNMYLNLQYINDKDTNNNSMQNSKENKSYATNLSNIQPNKNVMESFNSIDNREVLKKLNLLIQERSISNMTYPYEACKRSSYCMNLIDNKEEINNYSKYYKESNCSSNLNKNYSDKLVSATSFKSNKLKDLEIKYYKLIHSKSKIVVNRVYQLLKSCNGDSKAIKSLFPDFTIDELDTIYEARSSRQNNKSFNSYEDQKLFNLVNEYGPNFKLIAKFYNNKTACDLKRRYIKINTLNNLFPLNTTLFEDNYNSNKISLDSSINNSNIKVKQSNSETAEKDKKLTNWKRALSVKESNKKRHKLSIDSINLSSNTDINNNVKLLEYVKNYNTNYGTNTDFLNKITTDSLEQNKYLNTKEFNKHENMLNNKSFIKTNLLKIRNKNLNKENDKTKIEKENTNYNNSIKEKNGLYNIVNITNNFNIINDYKNLIDYDITKNLNKNLYSNYVDIKKKETEYIPSIDNKISKDSVNNIYELKDNILYNKVSSRFNKEKSTNKLSNINNFFKANIINKKNIKKLAKQNKKNHNNYLSKLKFIHDNNALFSKNNMKNNNKKCKTSSNNNSITNNIDNSNTNCCSIKNDSNIIDSTFPSTIKHNDKNKSIINYSYRFFDKSCSSFNFEISPKFYNNENIAENSLNELLNENDTSNEIIFYNVNNSTSKNQSNNNSATNNSIQYYCSNKINSRKGSYLNNSNELQESIFLLQDWKNNLCMHDNDNLFNNINNNNLANSGIIGYKSLNYENTGTSDFCINNRNFSKYKKYSFQSELYQITSNNLKLISDNTNNKEYSELCSVNPNDDINNVKTLDDAKNKNNKLNKTTILNSGNKTYALEEVKPIYNVIQPSIKYTKNQSFSVKSNNILNKDINDIKILISNNKEIILSFDNMLNSIYSKIKNNYNLHTKKYSKILKCISSKELIEKTLLTCKEVELSVENACHIFDKNSKLIYNIICEITINSTDINNKTYNFDSLFLSETNKNIIKHINLILNAISDKFISVSNITKLLNIRMLWFKKINQYY